MSKVKDRTGRGLSRGRNAVVHNRETLRHERHYKWAFCSAVGRVFQQWCTWLSIRVYRNRPVTAFIGRKRRPAIEGNVINPKCW